VKTVLCSFWHSGLSLSEQLYLLGAVHLSIEILNCGGRVCLLKFSNEFAHLQEQLQTADTRGACRTGGQPALSLAVSKYGKIENGLRAISLSVCFAFS
jgi:hypothetical protein